MDNSPFRSVLETLQEHIRLAPDSFPPVPANQLLFDPRLAFTTLPTPELSSHLSSLGLPAPLYHELNALLSNDLNEDKSFIEQTQERLIHQLSTLSSSANPSAVPALVQAAFRTFHNRSINSRIDALRRQISDFELKGDSGTESEESSGSDQESEGNDDEEEDEEDFAEEDDNAPLRPGEDIPPLETKYLPIFEALHERGKVLTKPEKTYLVNMTGMTYRQITIWFQNRRRGELKEDLNNRATSPTSDQTSDPSDDEPELEQQLARSHSDTTFNIRSWCLASAAAANNDASLALLPPSPAKSGFGAIDPTSGFESDSDLTDSEDEVDPPPGLKVPSLAMSVTTVDSGSDRGPATVASMERSGVPRTSSAGTSIMKPDSDKAGGFEFNRPIKSLPSARRTSPHAASPGSMQQTTAFSFDFAAAAPSPFQQPFPSATNPAPSRPSQSVTSDERGLQVQMETTPPMSTSTLQFSTAPTPLTQTNFNSPPRQTTSSPSPPPMITGSRHSTPSSSPSEKGTSSPRPTIKPLPRRTGCAPRPRPPPRAGSCATSVATPTSSRPSVVLPPLSNPSLGNTTLGALLRPNPPAPAIPAEMEERLSAMAGRMGVGAGSNSTRRNASADAAMVARMGVAPDITGVPPRGSSFSFGPAALPSMGASPAPRPMQTNVQPPAHSPNGSSAN